jgi:hypothetical protein
MFSFVSFTSFHSGYSFDNLDDGPANEYSIAVKSLVSVLLLLLSAHA